MTNLPSFQSSRSKLKDKIETIDHNEDHSAGAAEFQNCSFASLLVVERVIESVLTDVSAMARSRTRILTGVIMLNTDTHRRQANACASFLLWSCS